MTEPVEIWDGADQEGNSDEARLARLESNVELILDKMTKVENMVEKIVAEVKPTIDELMGSSLFKMLGVKKK